MTSQPRLKRGEWHPSLQSDLALAFMLLLALEVIVRGVDYLCGDRGDVTTNLTVVESAMPLPMWGLLLVVGGGLFLAGILLRRFTPIIIGSVLIMACYAALAAGLALRMIERGWPWDGYRTPVMFVCFALFFGIHAFSAYLKRSAVESAAKMQDIDDRMCRPPKEE